MTVYPRTTRDERASSCVVGEAFSEPFESLMGRTIELALSNGETRRGILFANPPGRLLVVGEAGPLVVMNSAVVGIVATGAPLPQFAPTHVTFRAAAVEPGPNQYADLTDFLASGVRVALSSAGEWEGVLVDVSPMGAEWLGVQKPDGSTVFIPSANVATVEALP